MESNWQVLLYYYYTPIVDTQKFKVKHKEFCISRNLTGRIIIASEGLNGTISGPKEDCDEYKDFIKKDGRFPNIRYKIDKCSEHLFPKMSIKIKNNLININRDDLDPNVKTGVHLSPIEFRNKMKSDDSIVVDMRSTYEHHIGKFKDAITFDIKHLPALEETIKESDFYNNIENKEKEILTYCTGGIKCEKASALLLKMGFKNVYQLHGGIIRYGKEVGGEDFDGKCYVFDDRITKDVNIINPKIITKCYICNKDDDTMVNCQNTLCNRHTTMCNMCYVKMQGCCSKYCTQSDTKRS